MRKILLFSLITSIALSGFTQPMGSFIDQVFPVQEIHPDLNTPVHSGVIGQKLYPATQIGTTWYDTQSYGNVMPRMIEYPDGSIGVTWMAAGENIANPERGAGYNYYNGTEWGTPNLHVGPADRHGWPNYSDWGPNGEIISVYKYDVNEGVILFFKRDIKGEGEWIESQLAGPDATSLVWQSMMTSGPNNEYIHLLAYSYDTPVAGQENALLYYRSSDGAETWEIEGEIIDGLGIDDFATINSLSYNWANPVGNTIAFTYGFNEYGGYIFKSTDNGDSWNRIQAYESPWDNFSPPTDTDPFPCGSGTSSIALDSEGMAHVVFSRYRKIWTDGTQYIYPYTDGLIYWNETMDILDTTIISSYTLEYLEDAGHLIGTVIADEPYEILENQPHYQLGMSDFSQISIDDQDNMFVTYSTLVPAYLTGTGFIYRHIAAVASWDGGASWTDPMDLNTDIQFIFSECVYPQLIPTLDNTLHLVFQEDFEPGVAEWLNNHSSHENRMFYMAVPKDGLIGIADQEEVRSFELSEIYPNPANTSLNFSVRLRDNSEVQLNLVNMMGQNVMQISKGRLSAGDHKMHINISDLDAGIYSCQVNVNGQARSKKVIVF